MPDALAWFHEHFPDSPPFGSLEREDDVATLEIPGGTLGFAYIPGPVPAGDLTDALEQTWHWPEASQAVKAHAAHMVCFGGSSELDILDMRLLHSRMVAALLATGGGSGVHIGDARLLKSAPMYIDEISKASRRHLPILSWVGFNLIRDEGAHSAHSTGLAEFGLLELEVRQSKLPWSALVRTLAEIAQYQITAALQSGDEAMLGDNPLARQRVRRTRSELMHATQVTLIDM